MPETTVHKFVNPKSDGADTTITRPSNWNDTHTVAQTMTNKAGGDLAVGDVVVVGYNDEESVVGTSAIGIARPVLVALEAITNNNQGKLASRGIVDVVKVQGAVSIGGVLRTSASVTRAEQVTLAETIQVWPKGAFAVALSSFAGPGSGTVKALLLGTTGVQAGLNRGNDISAASTLNPDTSAEYVRVNGTTTINNLPAGRPAGSLLVLTTTSTPTIAHSASLALADGLNVVAQAEQVFGFVCESAAGIWREIFRTRGIVNTAALKTATGSASGFIDTGSVDITMNDYSFFPSIHMETNDLLFRGQATDGGNTVGRFRIDHVGTGNRAYNIRWRYVTASDDPTIWVLRDQASGIIKGVWASDDPIPNGEAGLRSPGHTVHLLRPADLQIPSIDAFKQQADTMIRSKGQRVSNIDYRALQLLAKDDAPARWILENCTIDSQGVLAEKGGRRNGS